MSHSVLVCDDAIFMRTMISDILAQAGFEIVGEAETGSQAVEKYRQLKPDLVTMPWGSRRWWSRPSRRAPRTSS